KAREREHLGADERRADREDEEGYLRTTALEHDDVDVGRHLLLPRRELGSHTVRDRERGNLRERDALQRAERASGSRDGARELPRSTALTGVAGAPPPGGERLIRIAVDLRGGCDREDAARRLQREVGRLGIRGQREVRLVERWAVEVRILALRGGREARRE